MSKISFDIPKSGVTCLIGPSGIGKTTLLQVISAIKHPLNGNVYILGRDTRRMSYLSKFQLWKKQLSFHFQINNVIPQSSILYNITFKRFVSTSEMDMISELCGGIGLNMPISTKAKHLSVGQRNRLSIIRSFYADKALIILDEPLASLDLKSKKKVIDLINLYSQNRSVLIASHELIECENIVQVIDLNDYVG